MKMSDYYDLDTLDIDAMKTFYDMNPDDLEDLLTRYTMELYMKDMIGQNTTHLTVDKDLVNLACLLKANSMECTKEGLELLFMQDAMGISINY